ncbi:hypothetical protein NHP21011_06040 [Helicobacter heilmannii]|uniref:DUF779 domain-containing protein n=1 Tax=Helicobacter heilmannii TaxID=35817 RepID=UPI00244D81C6|nr:DUF779 domain-containing protein [Helicobacter heilmannii]GMB94512.1 hypothetical protein NHP21011_06040 [Helicobacter heilmannii]
MSLKASKAAYAFLKELKEAHKEGLILYHSCGCCEGGAVLVYAKGNFKLGDSDVCLGEIEGVGLYRQAAQEQAQNAVSLTLDVKPLEGSEFSLSYGYGKSFYLRP